MSRSEVDFDALYRADNDPWKVSTSWYERRKAAIVLASLPSERYRTAWEPGCGVGVLTRGLAQRCERVLATDVSGTAVALTRGRCSDLAGVTTDVSGLPDVPLDATVDLVVAAEFLYYLPELSVGVDALWSALHAGGHLVVVHWRHGAEDTRLSGADLHSALAADADRRGAATLVHHRDAEFTLDVWERP